jgi:hypothetical protein
MQSVVTGFIFLAWRNVLGEAFHVIFLKLKPEGFITEGYVHITMFHYRSVMSKLNYLCELLVQGTFVRRQ